VPIYAVSFEDKKRGFFFFRPWRASMIKDAESFEDVLLWAEGIAALQKWKIRSIRQAPREAQVVWDQEQKVKKLKELTLKKERGEISSEEAVRRAREI
jgi:hypothetical protein